MSSKVFNMVTVSAIKFADSTSDGSVPSSLNNVNILAEGKFTPAFEPGAVTQEFDEFTHLPYRGYRANGSYKFTIDLPKVSIQDYASFTGHSYDQVSDKITMGGQDTLPKPKYFEVYGDNVSGDHMVFKAFCGDVVAKWSGSVGAAQATVSVSIEVSMRLDNSSPAKMAEYGPAV